MSKNSRPFFRRWLCRLGWGFAILLLVLTAICVFGLWRPLPGERLTPSGVRRNSSQYVTVRDGTKLAVDVWLPATIAPSQRVSTVFRATRYFRALEPGPLLRINQGLHFVPSHQPDIDALNEAAFAHVIVDVRGTGASFGQRSIELAPREIDDLMEVLDWVVKQPWSNGRVGLFGMSYDGNAAELLAARAHPSVKAAAPIFSPWDEFQQPLRPGGLLNLALLEPWSRMIQAMDEGDLARAFRVTGWQRWLLALQVRGPKPVDEDRGRRLLAQAVSSHSTASPLAMAQALVFRDDLTTNGILLTPLSPAEHTEALARCGIPLLVQASWLDSDYGAAAVQRFQTLPNSQILIMGSWNHGGFLDADPFAASDKPATPSHEEQMQQIIDFMRMHLSEIAKPVPTREVRYITLAGGNWKTASHWPPEGFTSRQWFFHEDGRLDNSPSATKNAGDSYTVDFKVTAGPTTRWHQLGDGVVYTNRAEIDRRLLTYTSPRLEEAIELTGSPILRVHVSSTSTDGDFHAYLEDVAPDGRVTYITEGLLRALHRKLANSGRPPSGSPIQRSFLRADALPLVPGEAAIIEFELLPTSVVFNKGHRIRLALAGADAGNFERVPAEGTVAWRVYRDAEHPSHLEMPVRELGGAGDPSRLVETK